MKHIWIAGCFVSLMIGLFAGYSFSEVYSSTKYSMLKEFEVGFGNLERGNPSPQTREYLKSRIYFLSCHIDPHHLKEYAFDFGPVDEAALGNVSGVKGASNSDAYDCVRSRHGSAKAKVPVR